MMSVASRFRVQGLPGIQAPTVLRAIPSNCGVTTYKFVGFGVTGRAWANFKMTLAARFRV